MAKKSKLINIFEKIDDKKDFCTFMPYIILLITLAQVCISSFRYTQLNNFISDKENQINNIDSQDVQEADTKQFNINFDEMKEVCLLIGLENIESMILNSEAIEVKGNCKSVSKLEDLKNRDKVKEFNVEQIEKKDGQYNFGLSYKLEEK